MPPAIPDKIPCETEYQLEREIETLRIALDQEETEESWEPQLRAVARFKSLVRGGAYKHDSFVPSLKPLCRLISSPMLSERGRLSAVAIELISTLASALGRRFDPLMQGFAPTLMKLCQRPNKVVISRTQACITMVIKQTRLPSILPHLREAVKDKSASLRTIASDAAYLCITHIEVERIGNKVSDFESIIKTTGRDPNPEVRKQARAILQEYRERFPERYAMFISPLTPITRKYLDVNKFAVEAPQPLKLSGPAFKQLPPPSTASVVFPERPPSSASNHRPLKVNPLPSLPPAFQSEALPPRPHSVAAMRPKAAPFSHTPPTVFTNKPTTSSRPLNLLEPRAAAQNERPRSMFVEPTQRVEPQRSQHAPIRPIVVSLSGSQTTADVQRLPEARFDTDADLRQRQRSISVSHGRDEADRALRLLNGTHTSKPQQMQVVDGRNEPRPRAPSTTSGSSVLRSKSAMSMRRYDEALNRNRPISITSDTLEQFRFNEVENLHPAATSSRPTSIVVDSEPSRPPIPLPARTPRAAIERPQVIILPQSEAEAPRPRTQKTWSMSRQLELLNKKKKAREAKEEPVDVEPVNPAGLELPMANLDDGLTAKVEGTEVVEYVDTPIEEVGSNELPAITRAAVEKEVLAKPEELAPLARSTSTRHEEASEANIKRSDEVAIAFPAAESKPNTPRKVETVAVIDVDPRPVAAIAFPSSTVDEEEMTPSVKETASDPVAAFPTTKLEQVEAPEPAIIVAVKPSAVSKASQENTGPVQKEISTAPKAPNLASSRTRTISATSKQSAVPAATRARVVSSSSKDGMKMPVRVPSRNANQPTGFVPKRTVKNSITQPTKSQAARVQAVINERAAATRPAAIAPEKASQGSTARKPMNGKDQQQQHMSKAIMDEHDKGQMPLSAPETKQRVRDAPRKPPIPTVSSLVKAHAAKREAGLSQVALRLGAPSTASVNGKSGAIRTAKPKVLAAAAPLKKVALSVQERQAFKPRSNSAQVSVPIVSPKQDIKDILIAYGEGGEEHNKARSELHAKRTGHGLVSLDSGEGVVEKKPEISLVAERSDATMPLPSSSFSIGDEMMGITFKRVGEGYDAIAS